MLKMMQLVSMELPTFAWLLIQIQQIRMLLQIGHYLHLREHKVQTVQMEHRDQSAHKDQQALKAQKELKAQQGRKGWQAHKVPLVQLEQLAHGTRRIDWPTRNSRGGRTRRTCWRRGRLAPQTLRKWIKCPKICNRVHIFA